MPKLKKVFKKESKEVRKEPTVETKTYSNTNVIINDNLIKEGL